MENIINTTRKAGLLQTAIEAATSHRLDQRPPRQTHLLQRLPELSRRLDAAHQAFGMRAQVEVALSYAAEWLLDNFYLIRQAERQVQKDLPPRYYHELPKLATEDSLTGYPRIYAAARIFLLHEDAEFEPERLTRFIASYQERQVLTMGELWALPIMLRVALLETLTQAAACILARTAEKTGEQTDERLSPELPIFPPYEYQVEENDLVAHAIQSLRAIDSQDWANWFERVSVVHQLLAGDLPGIYARMDFATRNHYRSTVELLAKGSEQTEVDVAEQAIALARKAFDAHKEESPSSIWEEPAAGVTELWSTLAMPRQCHVGYYLLDQGRPALEAQIDFRPSPHQWLRTYLTGRATSVYLGVVGFLTILILVLLIGYALVTANALWPVLLATGLIFIPALTVAVDMANYLLMRMVSPRVLPKLDFEQGIPAPCRTMVVIPALVAHENDVESLFEQLEQHYLRNLDSNRQLTFALLSDFPDAAEPVRPEDERLLATARARLQQLNERYTDQPFYFFHRRRQWNPSEQTWMGWERKRGKLHEFNRLLRGDQTTSYFVQLGDLALLPQVRYVITLDADTLLPRGAAHCLVGALAHPLNRAWFDPQTGKVAAGYTILQPRTAIKPTSANRSLFTRVFGGAVGIDLYTLAVSDLYQDLFGAGIYVGKGIYEVDAFEQSLAGRVPENALLSHDLFEGVHGRVGLATDIVLYEDYPPHYLAGVRRAHRWVRGDWQLLPWLARNVPSARGLIPNDLALIDRWKLVDNLRRSLLAPSLLALLVAAWTVLSGAPLVWTAIAVLTPALALLLAAVSGLLRTAVSADRAAVWRSTKNVLQAHALRWLLFLAFLPYEALLFTDAIATTLVRLFVRRRKLLQWTTAERTLRLFGDELSATSTLRHMWPAYGLTLLITLLVLIATPARFWVALPLLILWLLASRIAYWISRPARVTEAPLTAEQERELRRLARHTWLFYEHFVGPTDNWLPPDHFQEAPRQQTAHRTSPTNVGMYLLAVLAAQDLGYIGALDIAARLRSTFDTLQRLDRHRGHFLNWIDTRTLEPLPPRYVSTVDSGNLAAALIALKQGCLMQRSRPIWHWERWEGLLDTLRLLDHAFELLSTAEVSPDNPLREGVATFQQEVMHVHTQEEAWYPLLIRLSTSGRERLNQLLLDWVEANPTTLDPDLIQRCRTYVERIHHHLDNLRRDVDRLQPWLARRTQLPALLADDTASPALAAAWRTVDQLFPLSPNLDQIEALCGEGRAALARLGDLLYSESPVGPERATTHSWLQDFSAELTVAQSTAELLHTSFALLAEEADQWVAGMDFGFLFERQRQVFHIGYNVDAGLLDRNYYDLLASEARIASLVAIAKYDVPQSHWLHLGRPLTRVANGAQALLSWSGTMFEYLMPPLLLREYPQTLLVETNFAIVDHQIAYGREQNAPWGISESGFYFFDAAMNYQYRAFGAPGLGFKRGLGEDLVVTPYAALLALRYRPHAVVENIERLRQMGVWGRYGLYEAVDFTQNRLMVGQAYAIVSEYMAHHQGMILVALANWLKNDLMVERFHSEPAIQSVELLLQEQVPQGVPLHYPHEDEDAERAAPVRSVTAESWRTPAHSPLPMAHFLSNGRYGLLLTNAGGGYSQWQASNLTRWRADATLDEWGCWLYVQDVESGALWSAGLQPTGAWPEHQEVHFAPHQVEFHRRDYGVTLHMAVTVAPDEDVEVRRISLTNESDQPRRLRLTTYGEVVLGPAGADLRHQAFGKLFIESEYIAEINALLFRRRPRAATESPAFLAHLLLLETEPGPAGQMDVGVTKAGLAGATGYESDRARFLGRGGTQRSPAALTNHRDEPWLSGTVGATLDPVMVLGQELVLPPHGSAQVAVLTLAAASRQALVEQARRYRNWSTIERTFSRARNSAEQEMRQLDLTSAHLEQYQQLFSLLCYPHPALRSDPATLAANRLGQSGLWAYGISGDYPILLLRLKEETHSDLLQELLRAHLYWRRRGLQIDLVLLNQQETNYGQPLQGFIHRMIERMESESWLNQRGGIFVLRADQMGEAERILLESVARVLLDGERGSVGDQLAALLSQPTSLPLLEPALEPDALGVDTPPVARPTDWQFDNGFGGFSADGREYQIFLQPGEKITPAPWINVIANPNFGFLISESGGGYTWAENSGENRLTPWRNDPVSDRPGEALYLRDEETAEVWSPIPQPAPTSAPYLVRHGAGYTCFEHASHGLRQTTRLFVAMDAPVKIIQIRLENCTERPRRLTATYYAEWVLGVDHEQTQLTLIPDYDDATQTLLVRNPYSADFGERVAFLAASQRPHGLTADRTEFLGRLGSWQQPAALARVGLENRIQAGLDPCAALQVHIDLAPGESHEFYFLLGQGNDREAALALAQRFQQPEQVAAAWQGVQREWACILDAVQVETPDPAFNLLLNRWLLYQTLVCRFWGRSALYQSSGAYGFRDQLQDVMALLHTRPELARAHILRAAQQQFEAGDVLHWWHPPASRGVRTRISDDLLWLPYVTAHYVTTTGDQTILFEEIPFLKGEPLGSEEERYAQYFAGDQRASLFEHCRRAIEKGMTAGAHGLPLMGAGDWNDGMNRVGIHGRGESIWLGWFLCAALIDFAALCTRIDQPALAARYRTQADAIRAAVEESGWDGEWYRRAYDDQGAPLGSAGNIECQIDSIAQSWAVLSGAGEPKRAAEAMHAVLERLVQWDNRLILLFTPPFDKTSRDPGYIKGYLPGVRENGGQYTHAALWSIWAFAELGHGDLADALFRLINPIHRTDTPAKAEHYQVEPYVISADVYGAPPHTGRGGWTWYTGSSGWMYRLGVEAILGLRRAGDTLSLRPCLPQQWPGFCLSYRFGETIYKIEVKHRRSGDAGASQTMIDGSPVEPDHIPLVDDGQPHQIIVTL
jgi:cyclic beta-1,2-glucan synthetase